MQRVRSERTNWRDSNLEGVHNQYGYELACDNVEFLMAEYDMSTPVAVIDYRLKGRLTSGPSDAVLMLCSNREMIIPYFICEYEVINYRLSNIVCFPCNVPAESIVDKNEMLTEKEFVKRLYRIREKIVKGRAEQGITIAESLSNTLSDSTENWPGQILSNRHRDYGWDCPVVDIDFIVVNHGQVRGLVEYKHMQSYLTPYKFKLHPTGKTLFYLANNMNEKIPLLFVYYNDSIDTFKVYPVTYGWDEYDNHFGIELTRDEYFNFLRSL